MGKKDHMCLQMFLECLISYSRRWVPKDMWKRMTLHSFSVASAQKSLDLDDRIRREKILAAMHYLKRKRRHPVVSP